MPLRSRDGEGEGVVAVGWAGSACWIVEVEDERLKGLERGERCVSFNSVQVQHPIFSICMKAHFW